MRFSWKKLLDSKLLLLFGIIVFIFLIVSFSREFTRRYYLEQQVKTLESNISKLETQNQEFSQLIDYFKTQSFTEEEARLKMGFKKPGEEVVVINPTEKKVDVKTSSEQPQLANPQKWLNYFLKHSNDQG